MKTEIIAAVGLYPLNNMAEHMAELKNQISLEF